MSTALQVGMALAGQPKRGVIDIEPGVWQLVEVSARWGHWVGAQGFLVNSDFETGSLAPWTPFHADVVSLVPGQLGGYACRFARPGGGPIRFPSITQTVTGLTGGAYGLACRVRHNSGGYQLALACGDGLASSPLSWIGDGLWHWWMPDVVGIPTAGNLTVSISSHVTNSAEEWFVDDVLLYDAATPPGLVRGIPAVRAKIKEYVIDQLETKYGAGCVTVASAFPGDVNAFRSFVPGSTPADSVHNFPLMYEEEDGSFEKVGFWLKSNYPQPMQLEYVEWR